MISLTYLTANTTTTSVGVMDALHRIFVKLHASHCNLACSARRSNAVSVYTSSGIASGNELSVLQRTLYLTTHSMHIQSHILTPNFKPLCLLPFQSTSPNPNPTPSP